MTLTEQKSELCSKEVSFTKSRGRYKNRNLSSGSQPILYHLDSEQMVPQYLSVEKIISSLKGEWEKVIYEVLLKKTWLLENK